jgi:hypothetical protein
MGIPPFALRGCGRQPRQMHFAFVDWCNQGELSMNRDIHNTHKRRELKKQRSRWIRPETIKTAILIMRLIDTFARIISRFL